MWRQCALQERGGRRVLRGLLVEDVLPIERKTITTPDDSHRMQCINYLKATGLQLCLLLNLGNLRMEIKRVVHGL
jgi:GxxExxY protein